MPHSTADQERGMLALVLAGGRATEASRSLAEQGHKISAATLRTWRKAHPERYDRLEVIHAPKIAERIAAECESLAVLAAQCERETMNRARETISRLRPAELSKAGRDFSTMKAINVDKAALLRGQPTVITESRSPDQIIEGISRKLGYIDSTADELP